MINHIKELKTHSVGVILRRSVTHQAKRDALRQQAAQVFGRREVVSRHHADQLVDLFLALQSKQHHTMFTHDYIENILQITIGYKDNKNKLNYHLKKNLFFNTYI